MEEVKIVTEGDTVCPPEFGKKNRLNKIIMQLVLPTSFLAILVGVAYASLTRMAFASLFVWVYLKTLIFLSLHNIQQLPINCNLPNFKHNDFTPK